MAIATKKGERERLRGGRNVVYGVSDKVVDFNDLQGRVIARENIYWHESMFLITFGLEFLKMNVILVKTAFSLI